MWRRGGWDEVEEGKSLSNHASVGAWEREGEKSFQPCLSWCVGEGGGRVFPTMPQLVRGRGRGKVFPTMPQLVHGRGRGKSLSNHASVGAWEREGEESFQPCLSWCVGEGGGKVSPTMPQLVRGRGREKSLSNHASVGAWERGGGKVSPTMPQLVRGRGRGKSLSNHASVGAWKREGEKSFKPCLSWCVGEGGGKVSPTMPQLVRGRGRGKSLSNHASVGAWEREGEESFQPCLSWCMGEGGGIERVRMELGEEEKGGIEFTIPTPLIFTCVSLQEICDRYFLLLIQLLSSQTTFPSGGKARAAICQSMVKLLVLLGEGLGREQACDLLRPTLQCFFASFSSVHQDDGREKATPTTTADSDVAEPLSPSPKHASHPEAKPVEFHPLTESLDDPKSGDDPKSSDTPSYMPDSEVYRQLCTTFSKAMAHTAYVNFCMLLGQYYLHDCLCNADLIEQIAYSHDEMEHPQSPLTSILTETLSCDSDTNSESESDEESDDDMGMARDAALKVGPIAAVTGLGMEEAGFRKSSWFVDLEGVEKDDAGGREVRMGGGMGGGGKERRGRGRGGREGKGEEEREDELTRTRGEKKMVKEC